MSNPAPSTETGTTLVEVPVDSSVTSQEREWNEDDNRFYDRLEERYNAADNEEIKENVKACMDYVYENRSPAHSGEILWASDGQAHMCSEKKYGELWVNDLSKRENRDEMIITAGPDWQISTLDEGLAEEYDEASAMRPKP